MKRTKMVNLSKIWFIACAALFIISVQVACGNSQHDNDSNRQDEVETVHTENAPESSETEEQPFKPIHGSFIDGKGNVTELSDLRGKVIFINMWATWCPPCIKEMPSLNRLHDKLKDNDNIEFLFVELDDDYPKAEKFLAKHKYDIPLYSVHGELPYELATNSIPTTIIIDKKGEMNVKHMGAVDFDQPQILEHLEALMQ